MKSIDLGVSHGKTSHPEASPMGKSPGKTYPNFSVRDVELPFSSKDVGKTVTVVLKMKVLKAGHEIDTYSSDRKKKYRAEFQPVSMQVGGKSKADLKSMDEMSMDAAEKDEYDAMSLFGGAKRGKR